MQKKEKLSEDEVQAKLLLRNIGSHQVLRYLTDQGTKKKLNYPSKCLLSDLNSKQIGHYIQKVQGSSSGDKDQFKTSNYYQDDFKVEGRELLMSLDCEMVLTRSKDQKIDDNDDSLMSENQKEHSNKLEVVRVVILNHKREVVYDKWFKPAGLVIDYMTNITGITENLLGEKAQSFYTQTQKNQISKILQGKILVGHDAANDMKVLDIEHFAFIDTVALCPHNYGLPFKPKLQTLAAEQVHMHIQWGSHDPIEDAEAAFKIVLSHISQGKGTVQEVPYLQNIPRNPESYENVWEILKDAQLDQKLVVGLFLRGSRALGLVVDEPSHKSDWDYVCVYDTDAVINGRLIKLHQIDISIFDLRTFNYLISQQCDISYIELFFLPQDCQIVNKLPKPEVEKFPLSKLRDSLGFHLSKAKVKIKRFKGDPSKNWKCIKAVHMKMRFMDNFIQIVEFGYIKDPKRLSDVWKTFKEKFKVDFEGNFEKTLQWCEAQCRRMKEKVSSVYQTQRRHRGGQGERYFQNNNRRGSTRFNLSHSDHYESKALKSKGQEFKEKGSESDHSLQIVNELRNMGYLRLDQLRITMKRGEPPLSNLIEFHYLQGAPFEKKICSEARGIILDESRNFEVVAYPYDKFYDYNDPKYSQVKNFNFKSYEIYEKHDGSIAFLYWYSGEWRVASAKVPDGSTNYCFARKENTTTFRNEFWRIFKEKGFKLPDQEDSCKTFIFELMSKNHIIVVSRVQDSLVLHGVRDTSTLLQESHTPYGKKYGWDCSEPLSIKLQNPFEPIPQLERLTKKLDPLVQEGFVLCDDKFTRLKIKSPDYIRVNWLGQLNLTTSKDPKKYILCEIVLNGEGPIFAKYCPEWARLIYRYEELIGQLNSEVYQMYEQIKDLKGGKAVPKAINKMVGDRQEMAHFLYALKKHHDLYKGRVEQSMTAKRFYKFILKYESWKKGGSQADEVKKAVSEESFNSFQKQEVSEKQQKNQQVEKMYEENLEGMFVEQG